MMQFVTACCNGWSGKSFSHSGKNAMDDCGTSNEGCHAPSDAVGIRLTPAFPNRVFRVALDNFGFVTDRTFRQTNEFRYAKSSHSQNALIDRDTGG